MSSSESVLAGSSVYGGKVFTTEPKIYRRLYGLTLKRKNAARLMESLFQAGFIVEAPYDVVKEFLVRKVDFISPEDRTLDTYIGRPATILDPTRLPETHLTITYEKTQTQVFKKYSAKRFLREKLGLCHALGYLRFEYRGKDKFPFLVFNHREVPLPYHLLQKPLLDSEKSEVVVESKDDLCVCPIVVRGSELRGSVETVGIDRRERRVSKQHTQIHSKDCIGVPSQPLEFQLTPAQKATVEERDRKRQEILDSDYLNWLEKSVKTQR